MASGHLLGDAGKGLGIVLARRPQERSGLLVGARLVRGDALGRSLEVDHALIVDPRCDTTTRRRA